MAPRWLDGLADVLDRPDAPCFVMSEELAEQVTGFHVHRGALASLHRSRCRGRGRCWPTRGGWCSRTSSTTRTSGRFPERPPPSGVDAVLLSPRCADPLYRRSVKVAWARSSRCPGPGWSWYDALPPVRGRVHHVALTPADDAADIEHAVADRDKVALLMGTEGPVFGALGAVGRRAGRDPDAAGIDSLNVAAATAVAATSPPTADPTTTPANRALLRAEPCVVARMRCCAPNRALLRAEVRVLARRTSARKK